MKVQWFIDRYLWNQWKNTIELSHAFLLLLRSRNGSIIGKGIDEYTNVLLCENDWLRIERKLLIEIAVSTHRAMRWHISIRQDIKSDMKFHAPLWSHGGQIHYRLLHLKSVEKIQMGIFRIVFQLYHSQYQSMMRFCTLEWHHYNFHEVMNITSNDHLQNNITKNLTSYSISRDNRF